MLVIGMNNLMSPEREARFNGTTKDFVYPFDYLNIKLVREPNTAAVVDDEPEREAPVPL